ncbi:MAG: inner membrane CreD family protein, partial [Muribaculaceae bacterium]|nr:inner membrane CreD family protein [Muribaculaceae bacterium]
VGLALVLFYSLLLSISEHLSFGWAYLIAAAMTIAMITLYLIGVLKHKKMAIAIGGMLTLIYAYIFVLLNLETYALLAGSVGLFIVLALIMYYSLKLRTEDLT